MDQAENLLRQTPFDRSTVHRVCRVLEDAWTSIRGNFAGSAAEKTGRMNVADGILGLARAGQRDPEILRIMQRRGRPPTLGTPLFQFR